MCKTRSLNIFKWNYPKYSSDMKTPALFRSGMPKSVPDIMLTLWGCFFFFFYPVWAMSVFFLTLINSKQILWACGCFPSTHSHIFFRLDIFEPHTSLPLWAFTHYCPVLLGWLCVDWKCQQWHYKTTIVKAIECSVMISLCSSITRWGCLMAGVWGGLDALSLL